MAAIIERGFRVQDIDENGSFAYCFPESSAATGDRGFGSYYGSITEANSTGAAIGEGNSTRVREEGRLP
jgi:hypothetical protein